MKKNQLVLLACLFFANCRSDKGEEKQYKLQEKESIVENNSQVRNDSSKTIKGYAYQANPSNFDEIFTYMGNKNDVKQELKVIYIEKNKISFNLKQYANGEECSVSGIANSDSNSDPELDEDEDGNMYPSSSYNYENKNCFIYIRIGLNNKNYAQILSDIDTCFCSNTKLIDIGILHLKQ